MPCLQRFVTARVADKAGSVLGWIVAKPCQKTGRRDYCTFDWDAVEFPDEDAARKRANRDGVRIIAINCYS